MSPGSSVENARTRKPENSPEVLGLVTGVADDARPHLYRDDDLFETFLAAWRDQRTWSDDEHLAFWRAGFHLWPRPKGQRTGERWASALYIARQRGLTTEEADAQFGLAVDTLQRHEKRHGLSGSAATDYCLPRIYVPDGPGVERRPNAEAYLNLPADIVSRGDSLTSSIAARLEAIG